MNKIGILKEIDRLGRIVIPKELRERYGLNDVVEVIATEDGVLIKNPKYYLAEKSETDSESYRESIK